MGKKSVPKSENVITLKTLATTSLSNKLPPFFKLVSSFFFSFLFCKKEKRKRKKQRKREKKKL